MNVGFISPGTQASTTLIGFTGQARSGKSTACSYLTQFYPFYELNFAESLKKGTAHMFGWTEDSMYNPELKDVKDPLLDFSRRQALQTLGTDVVRKKLGEDTWIKLLWRKVEKVKLSMPHTSICIGDVRFDNEADFIRKHGGIIVHVQRKKVLPYYGEQAAREEALKHISEAGVSFLEGQDCILVNDGKISDFHRRIRQLVRYALYGESSFMVDTYKERD